MTFLHNLWRDLVDKRLWPVAAALVVAIAAVPFLIDSGSSASTAVAPGPSVTPALGGAPTVGAPTVAPIAVAATPGGKPVNRAGGARDPFRPLVFAQTAKVPTAATAAGPRIPPPAATPAKGAGAVKGPAPTQGGPSAKTPSAGPATKPTPKTPTTTRPTPKTPTTTTTTHTRLLAYAIGVVMKRAGRITSRHGIHAITFLPSPAFPLLTFLGVKGDGQTATFLLANGAVVLGARTACRPSSTRCDVVELKAGENVLLTRTPKGGVPGKPMRFIVRTVGLREIPALRKRPAARTRAAALTSSGPALPTDLAPARQVTRTRTTD